MFTSKATLAKKTGPDRIGRHDFLKQLIVEFYTTTSIDAKKQTLANLANFAYDPVNYEYMKQLHCIDLFLAQLSEPNEALLNFALAGLCNISPDPETKHYIITLNGIGLISQQLRHPNADIALNAIACLYYLLFPESPHLVTPELRRIVAEHEPSADTRFRNIAAIFAESLPQDA